VKVEFQYLSDEIDRHGRPRVYVRRGGKRVRIRAPLGSPEFAAEYAAALQRLPGKRVPTSARSPQPFAQGTFGWLAAKYFASPEFLGLPLTSQSARRRVIESCLRESFSDTDLEPMGNCPLVHLTAQKIRRLRDLKRNLPGAANTRKKWLSAMFTWATEQTRPLLATNPAREVKRITYATDGWHTWTSEEVRQYEARHPIGSKARLALALLLFTGVRRSDVVRLGPANVQNGWLRFIPKKTSHKRKAISEKPWLRVLADIVEKTPVGSETFLQTEYGKPFTAAGFGGWFRDRCDEAGLSICSAHGLRKSGATLAAENGATVHQLMAIFDWSNPAQAKPYTDAADRKRMAGDAMGLLAKRTSGDRDPVAS
jgi:integrase